LGGCDWKVKFPDFDGTKTDGFAWVWKGAIPEAELGIPACWGKGKEGDIPDEGNETGPDKWFTDECLGAGIGTDIGLKEDSGPGDIPTWCGGKEADRGIIDVFDCGGINATSGCWCREAGLPGGAIDPILPGPIDVLTVTRASFWPGGTPRWVMGWLGMGNGDTPDTGRCNEDTVVCSCPMGVGWLKVTGNECEAFLGGPTWPRGLAWVKCGYCKICLGGGACTETCWFGIIGWNPGWAPKVGTLFEVCDGKCGVLARPNGFGEATVPDEANAGVLDGTTENHGVEYWKLSSCIWVTATGCKTAWFSRETESAWEGWPSWLWPRISVLSLETDIEGVEPAAKFPWIKDSNYYKAQSKVQKEWHHYKTSSNKMYYNITINHKSLCYLKWPDSQLQR